VFATDDHVGIAYGMGITAEKVAEEWKVSREDQDAFAVAIAPEGVWPPSRLASSNGNPRPTKCSRIPDGRQRGAPQEAR
jgi:hypothetical protein